MVQPPLIGEFGYELDYTLGGRAYLHAALFAGGGTALVHYPVGVQIVWPKFAHPGDQVTVTTKLIPADGSYVAIGQTPTYKAALSAGIQADVSLNFWLEAFGYYLRDGTDNPLLDWHPKAEYTLFDLDKGLGDFVISEGILYGHINKPDFTGAYSAPNSLNFHDSRSMGGLTADVSNLISKDVLGVNLSDTYDIAGYKLGYDLVDLRGDITLDANVDLQAKLTPRIRFNFSDGSPSKTVEIGKTVTFNLKGDSVTVTPTLLVDGEMDDSHSITLGTDMTFDPFHMYGRGSVAGYDLSFDLPPGDSFKTTLFDTPIISLPIVSGSEKLAGSASQMPYVLVIDTSPMKIAANPSDFGTTMGIGTANHPFRSIAGTVAGGYSTNTTFALVTCPNDVKAASTEPFLTKNMQVSLSTDTKGVGQFEVDGNATADLALLAGAHDGDTWQVQLVTPAQGGKPQQVSNSVPVQFDHRFGTSSGGGGNGSGSGNGIPQLKPARDMPGGPIEDLLAKGVLVVDSPSQISQTFENSSQIPGSIFSRDATYLFDGQPIPTRLTFGTEKTVVGGVSQYKTTYQSVGQIPASSVTRSGNHLIEFRNGGVGAAKTSVKQVTAIEPQPAVQRVGVPSAHGDAGTRNAPLALYGTGFTANSKILIDGKAVPTRFVSSSQLQVDASSIGLQVAETQRLQVSNAGGVGGGLSPMVSRSLLRSRPLGAKGMLDVKNTIFADALVEHKKETPQATPPALKPLKGRQLTGVLGDHALKNPLPPAVTNDPALAALLTIGNAGNADLRDVRLRSLILTFGGTSVSLPMPKEVSYERLRPLSRNIVVLHAPASAKGWKEGDVVEVVVTGTADGKPFRIAQQTRIVTQTKTPPSSPAQIRFDQ